MKLNKVKDILVRTCQGLCRDEESVNVTHTELSNTISFSILVHNSDQAKVIGSKGKNIRSIKNIFENIEIESDSGKYKTVKIFLDSAGKERSEHVKFRASTKWDSEPYAILANDMYEMFTKHIEIEFDDMGSLSVFEIKNYKKCPGYIGRSIKYLLESIGKCKGGTIDINYVE